MPLSEGELLTEEDVMAEFEQEVMPAASASEEMSKIFIVFIIFLMPLFIVAGAIALYRPHPLVIIGWLGWCGFSIAMMVIVIYMRVQRRTSGKMYFFSTTLVGRDIVPEQLPILSYTTIIKPKGYKRPIRFEHPAKTIQAIVNKVLEENRAIKEYMGKELGMRPLEPHEIPVKKEGRLRKASNFILRKKPLKERMKKLGSAVPAEYRKEAEIEEVEEPAEDDEITRYPVPLLEAKQRRKRKDA